MLPRIEETATTEQRRSKRAGDGDSRTAWSSHGNQEEWRVDSGKELNTGREMGRIVSGTAAGRRAGSFEKLAVPSFAMQACGYSSLPSKEEHV
jgi:hypothetical protein